MLIRLSIQASINGELYKATLSFTDECRASFLARIIAQMPIEDDSNTIRKEFMPANALLCAKMLLAMPVFCPVRVQSFCMAYGKAQFIDIVTAISRIEHIVAPPNSAEAAHTSMYPMFWQ